MPTRRAAFRVGWRAWRRYGVPRRIAFKIAFACRRFSNVRYALAYAVCEQETGFAHIFGHDVGGLFPGLKVTRRRYRKLRKQLRESHGIGANGVGPFQITYWTYIVASPGLWKLRANIYKGVEILSKNVAAYGEREGLAVYNGGAGNPQFDYASQVEARDRKIRPKLD